jgi:hypothetical protein
MQRRVSKEFLGQYVFQRIPVLFQFLYALIDHANSHPARKVQSIGKRIFLKKFSLARRERRPRRVFSLRHVLAKLIEIMVIMTKPLRGSAD